MSEVSVSAAPRMRPWMWWLAWAAATVCVVLFARKFDLHALAAELSHAHPAWICAAMLSFFLVLPLLTEQWMRLLPRRHDVRWGTMWECVTLSFAAMNMLPFGGGHALATGLLARRAGIGFEGGVSLMALEQVCESLVKSALLALTLFAAPVPPEWRTWAWVGASTLLAGSVAVIIFGSRPANAFAMGSWRHRWAHHLEVLRQPRILFAALAFGVGTKLADLVAVYAVQRSLGVTLPISTLPLVFTAVSVATLIAVSPGNLGVYEAAAFAVYRWLGVPAEQALALGLVQHACYLVPMIGTGYSLTIWRAVKSRRATRPADI